MSVLLGALAFNDALMVPRYQAARVRHELEESLNMLLFRMGGNMSLPCR
jgi:hypothetical protein